MFGQEGVSLRVQCDGFIMTKEEAKIEELSDDDVPELEVVETPAAASSSSATPDESQDDVGLQSRSEKKARKALSKMGLKQLSGITRITMRKKPNIMFVINNPDVYKSPSSDTYVFFGEYKVEDVSARARAQEQYAQQLAHAQQQEQQSSSSSSMKEAAASSSSAGDEDEEGVSPKDITLVMNQGNVDRVQAVAALKRNNNDVVNALMDLMES